MGFRERGTPKWHVYPLLAALYEWLQPLPQGFRNNR